MARKPTKKTPESHENLARKIWLAGLGAYGKSVEDAQGQLDKASQEASKMFSDLVRKGQDIEDQSKEALRERLSEARGKITGARNRLTEAAGSNTRSVEEMIGRVREKMGLDEPVHDKLDALTRQINSIADAVATMSGTRKPAAKSAPAARRKPAPRKKAATTTRTAAKKRSR